jgi:hypothetical protein
MDLGMSMVILIYRVRTGMAGRHHAFGLGSDG